MNLSYIRNHNISVTLYIGSKYSGTCYKSWISYCRGNNVQWTYFCEKVISGAMWVTTTFIYTWSSSREWLVSSTFTSWMSLPMISTKSGFIIDSNYPFGPYGPLINEIWDSGTEYPPISFWKIMLIYNI